MVKMTSEHPFISPLARLADEPVGPESARLTDWSGRVVLDVRGRDSLPQLRRIFDTVPESIGEIAYVKHGVLAQLRADRWIYVALSVSDEAYSFSERLSDQILIDITHAYGILNLRGTRVPGVLAQLCGLDFGDKAFLNRRAAQTSLAKVPALIMRLDDDVREYLILVERSVTAYGWTVMSNTVRVTE